jgi:hypothetical protein
MARTRMGRSAYLHKSYLLFAKNWKVEDDFKGLSIGGNNDQLSDASVEGFCGFVGTFLDLFESGTLSDEISEFRRELFSGEGLGTFRDILNEMRMYHFAIVDLLLSFIIISLKTYTPIIDGLSMGIF